MIALKTRIVLLSAALSVMGLLGTASPAQAWDCSQIGTGDVNAEEACRVAATVICTVVAKGEPCIY